MDIQEELRRFKRRFKRNQEDSREINKIQEESRKFKKNREDSRGIKKIQEESWLFKRDSGRFKNNCLEYIKNLYRRIYDVYCTKCKENYKKAA